MTLDRIFWEIRAAPSAQEQNKTVLPRNRRDEVVYVGGCMHPKSASARYFAAQLHRTMPIACEDAATTDPRGWNR